MNAAFRASVNLNFHCGSGGLRYTFNGQEKESEIAEGVTTAEFWAYDSRLARRWNLDPYSQISISDYAVLGNCPITITDPFGDKIKFGTDGMDRSEKRRIKRQVKGRMRMDKEFRKNIRAMRKESNSYTFLDRHTRMEDNGLDREVDKKSINEVDLTVDQYSGSYAGNSEGEDKDVFILWNTDLLPKPDAVYFNSNSVTVADPESRRKGLEGKANEIDYNIAFRNTQDMFDLLLWIDTHPDKNVTFNIYDDNYALDTKKDGSRKQTLTEKLTGEELYQERKREIVNSLAPSLNSKQLRQISFEHAQGSPVPGVMTKGEAEHVNFANCKIVYGNK